MVNAWEVVNHDTIKQPFHYKRGPIPQEDGISSRHQNQSFPRSSTTKVTRKRERLSALSRHLSLVMALPSTASTTTTEVIVDIVFGISATVVSAVTVYQGQRLWKLWMEHRGGPPGWRHTILKALQLVSWPAC